MTWRGFAFATVPASFAFAWYAFHEGQPLLQFVASVVAIFGGPLLLGGPFPSDKPRLPPSGLNWQTQAQIDASFPSFSAPKLSPDEYEALGQGMRAMWAAARTPAPDVRSAGAKASAEQTLQSSMQEASRLIEAALRRVAGEGDSATARAEREAEREQQAVLSAYATKLGQASPVWSPDWAKVIERLHLADQRWLRYDRDGDLRARRPWMRDYAYGPCVAAAQAMIDAWHAEGRWRNGEITSDDLDKAVTRYAAAVRYCERSQTAHD